MQIKLPLAGRTTRIARPRPVRPVPQGQQSLPWAPQSPEAAAMAPEPPWVQQSLPWDEVPPGPAGGGGGTPPPYGPDLGYMPYGPDDVPLGPDAYGPQPPPGFVRPGAAEGAGDWRAAMEEAGGGGSPWKSRALAGTGAAALLAWLLQQGGAENQGTMPPGAPQPSPMVDPSAIPRSTQSNPEGGPAGTDASKEPDLDFMRELEAIRKARTEVERQLEAFSLRMALAGVSPEAYRADSGPQR